MTYILGFTGTRRGMTDAQLSRFRYKYAMRLPRTFVHGGAIGADEHAHQEAIKFTAARDIEIFPGSRDRELYWRAKFPTLLVVEWRQPLLRNRAMVARCDRLIACPGEPDEVLRSGTWATVRYARAAGKPVTLILPDGTVKEEGA